MLTTLLFILLNFITPTSIYTCLPHTVDYVGYMESNGGYLDKYAYDHATLSFQLNDIIGTEIDWYDPQFNDYEFLAERAVYSADLEIDYLYFYTNGDNTLVYVLDTVELGADFNEHGCGAFLVEDVDWLTETTND